MRRTSFLTSLLALALLAGGCLAVDPATIPPPAIGRGRVVIVATAGEPEVQEGGEANIAAFRTTCRWSHNSFDDPIVKPGGVIGPNRAHMHSFFGNTGTDANSTAESIATTGRSTCDGGIANRSAYWAPAILNVTGEEPYPLVHFGGELSPLQVYYKSGYDGVRAEDIVRFPEGLRMIAGKSRATEPQTEDNTVDWHCSAGPRNDTGISQRGHTMPICAAGEYLVMAIEFPQCWDGRNLDSADHISHMAYGLGYLFRGCPASHPVELPQITQNYRWLVPDDGMEHWRLASDMDLDAPAGMTAHADWMNGWDPDVFQRIIDGCYHVPVAAGRDCSTNLLGSSGEALG